MLLALSLASLQAAHEAAAQATVKFQTPYAFAQRCSEDASAVLLFTSDGQQLWTEGVGAVDLAAPGVEDPTANGLSADGETVVGRARFSNVLRPAYWTAAEGWTSLGSELVREGGAVPCFDGIAYDASRDGSVIVGSTRVATGTALLPMVWTAATGMVELPSGPGQAFLVSDDGEVIWGRIGDLPGRWVQWSASGELTGSLSAPPGGFGRAEITGMSPDGDHVVGTGGLLGGVIWDQALGFQSPGDFTACCPVTEPIGTLGFPLGGLYYAVNNGGSVAVGEWAYEVGVFDRRRFPIVWTPGGGARRLQDELELRGADLMGRTILSAGALSSDGSKIVGQYSGPAPGEGGWYIAEWDLSVGDTFCASVDLNSTGVQGALTAQGSAALAHEQLTMLATDLPSFVNGFLISSPEFVPFSNSPPPGNNLCLRGDIGRHVGTLRNSGAGGAMAIPVDLTSMPLPSGMAVAAMVGETWGFQVWHRDSVGFGSAFTQAVSVVLR